MAAMAKVQQAGAAANIGHGTRSKKAQALNSHQKSAQDRCAQKWSSFYYWTIGTEPGIKNVNIFVMRVASQRAFVSYLENPWHFFWPSENRSV
jgi:hypothetical protein